MLDIYVLYRDVFNENYRKFKLHNDVVKKTRLPELLIKNEAEYQANLAAEEAKLNQLAAPHHDNQLPRLAKAIRIHLAYRHTGLFNYSMAVALTTAQQWKDPEFKTMCAFTIDKSRLTGFLHFRIEERENASSASSASSAAASITKVLYISQMGVRDSGKGIAQKLMHTVMSEYSPRVDVTHILFRNFNEVAKHIYEKLGFQEGDPSIAESYGYSPQMYCSYQQMRSDSSDSSVGIK